MSNAKKIISTVCLLVFVLSFAFIFVAPSPSEASINTPWLHVDGKYIKDPGGNVVVLRGVSMIDTGAIEHQGAFRGGKTAVDLVRMATDEANGWYSRVVRLPVYPVAIDGEAGWNNCWYNGKLNNSYFDDHLEAAVQEAINRGVYCIIDWHYIDSYQDKDQQTRDFWTFIANKYKNTPNVIFELFNEPTYPDDWGAWKTTAQGWVNLIRSIAPDNLIIVGGPRWSQNLGQAATNPIQGGNIVYSAHYYPTHGGSSTWDPNFGNAANSVPFLNTEWGFQHDGDSITSGTVNSYGQAYKDYLNTKGISWTAWTFDNDYKPVMFSTRVSTWDLAGSPGNTHGDSSYNDHMGQFVKDWLYEKRNSNLPSGSGAVTPSPSGGTSSPNIISGAVYRLEAKNDNSKVLDVSGMRSTDGTNVGIWSNYNNNAQKWKITDAGGGYYRLAPLCAPNSSLDVNGLGKTNGTNIQIWTNYNNNAQKFKFILNSDGYCELEPACAPGMRVDLNAGNTADGTNVQLWTANGNNAQRWKLVLVSSPTNNTIENNAIYKIVPKNAPGSALDVSGEGSANGTNVQIWTSYNNSAQKWQFIDKGNGYYKLVPLCATGSALDVSGGGGSGSNVQIWASYGNAAQQWKFYPTSDGYYTIEPACAPGTRLDLSGGQTANGTNVQIYNASGGDAQKWMLVKY